MPIRPLQLYADGGYQLRIRRLEGTPNYGPRQEGRTEIGEGEGEGERGREREREEKEKERRGGLARGRGKEREFYT
jgi:hypothetical protein